ncbi:MAG: hypothetical protein ACJ76P_05660 [Actinomycetota bacterium]
MGVVEVDGGLVAFADPMHLHHAVAMARELDGWRPVESTSVPRNLVAIGTGGDMPVPVEIRRGGDGATVAARMAFVDDLDDLDGGWVEVGRLAIGGSGCVALDPTVPLARAKRVRFELPAGIYLAEAFETEDDTLALRLAFERGDG